MAGRLTSFGLPDRRNHFSLKVNGGLLCSQNHIQFIHINRGKRKNFCHRCRGRYGSHPKREDCRCRGVHFTHMAGGQVRRGIQVHLGHHHLAGWRGVRPGHGLAKHEQGQDQHQGPRKILFHENFLLLKNESDFHPNFRVIGKPDDKGYQLTILKDTP